ncbi:MAG: lipopolysaccharide transport periplasmic protein LptA [Sulfuricellaceae bacterium]
MLIHQKTNSVATILLLALLASPAVAELADRNKPINLEADNMTVDEAKKISVYQGGVLLTQGTLMIRADKLVVSENRDGSNHGIAYGNPASFRQKREATDEFVEGYGNRIEYDSGKELVEMFIQARMKRNQDEVRGSYISYDAKTEFFKVLGGKEAVTPNNPRGRVHAVIQPKKREEAPVNVNVNNPNNQNNANNPNNAN